MNRPCSISTTSLLLAGITLASAGCNSPYVPWSGTNPSRLEMASDRVRLNAEVAVPQNETAAQTQTQTQTQGQAQPAMTAHGVSGTPQSASPQSRRMIHATSTSAAHELSGTTLVRSPSAPPTPRARIVHRTEIEPSSMPISVYGQSIDHAPGSGWAMDSSPNTRQITFGSSGSMFDPDIDMSGSKLVFSSTRYRQTSDIYIKAVGASTMTQLTTDAAHDIMPTFSPDTGMIAFASERASNWDIYYMDANGGQAVQLTNDPDDELHPTWSPDGRKIAYCKFGSRTGRWEIWVLDLENPGTPTFLTFGIFPTWSPDVATNKILFQRSPERDSQFHSIWTIDYTGGDARNTTMIASAENAALINPAWSPDGSRIVFVTVTAPSNLDGQPSFSDLWTVDLDGQRRTNLTRGRFANYQPNWGRDGNIYFVSDRSGAENIWAIAVDSPVNGRLGTNIATVQPGTERP